MADFTQPTEWRQRSLRPEVAMKKRNGLRIRLWRRIGFRLASSRGCLAHLRWHQPLAVTIELYHLCTRSSLYLYPQKQHWQDFCKQAVATFSVSATDCGPVSLGHRYSSRTISRRTDFIGRVCQRPYQDMLGRQRACCALTEKTLRALREATRSRRASKARSPAAAPRRGRTSAHRATARRCAPIDCS